MDRDMSEDLPEDARTDAAGFAPDLPDKLSAGIRSGLLRHIHAVIVRRNGIVAVERYFEGTDAAWDEDLGHITFEAGTLHDVRSVTKSIVGLLYGIALDKGIVPPPAAPLYAQFPEYPDLIAETGRDAILVEHALTMTLGLDWNERLPYTDAENCERAMEKAPDRNRFILGRPIVAGPGSTFCYSGGAVALLGALIARGAGVSLKEFAQKTLFSPLGIVSFEWAAGEDGVVSAASGLRLCARDLMKVGQLVLLRGVWNDQQIVSRSWLQASFKPAIDIGDGLMYGRLWYLGKTPTAASEEPQGWIGAFGNGGQRIWVMPSQRLVAVLQSGNYDAPDAWVTPVRLWREIILSNMKPIDRHG